MGGRKTAAVGSLRRALLEVRPHWRHLAAVFLLELMATPLLLLNPVPLKIAVDSIIGDRPLGGIFDVLVPDALLRTSTGLLAFTALLQILVVLLSQLQSLSAQVLRTVTGERMTLLMRSRLFSHTQRLSFSFHDRRGTADSVYRIQYDAQSFQYVTLDSILPFTGAMVSLVTTLTVIAGLSGQLALVALTVSPLLVVFSRQYTRRVRPRYRHVKSLESGALRVVQEVLTSLRVVQSFGQEGSEQERFLRKSRQGVRARIRLAFAENAFGLIVSVTTALGTAAVLYIGTRNVIAGVLTVGELLLVVAYLAQLYDPLKTMSRKVGVLQSSLAGVERASELLDEVPEVREAPHARPLRRASGQVEFRDVSFGYEPGQWVLRDVNLNIAAGMRLGIAGRTGAGKTTLVGLLSRFYDPTQGSILLDGVDLREYRLADLRNQFAIVLQDPVLFSTSIAENIAYARPRAPLADVVVAAKSAGMHDFVTRLPEGYDTVVGERGMRLSGGERQRVSLARAFLKDAPILVLDEPTSSVDVMTEQVIMDAMSRLMEGRTTLMIAHRLSTLDACDSHIAIIDGRVFEASAMEERDRRASVHRGP